MKQLLFCALAALSIPASGQRAKWQVAAIAQPELTCYQSDYIASGSTAKATLNMGGAVLARYNIDRQFFIQAGAGFISRTLRMTNYLNQAMLPPPRQSYSEELVTLKEVSYRVLSLPVSAGYRFLEKGRLGSFATAGFTGNYLVNTRYQSNVEKYDGTYKKNEWQGYSVNVGAGADYKLTPALSATVSLTYAVIHKLAPDEYTYNQTPRYHPLLLGAGFQLSL